MLHFLSLFSTLLVSLTIAKDLPSVKLQNAAVPGTEMPAMGIGTFGYALFPGGRAEYWNNSAAETAVLAWLKAGGSRIDTAEGYGDQPGIGKAIREQAVPRNKIFITSKVGGGPLGYNETIKAFNKVIGELNTTYVDLLLIHWPGPLPKLSSDPKCTHSSTGRDCRQSSWLAMEFIFKSGGAKAIGVSNFEQNHLQDIIDLKSLLPAVNQFEYHPYWHEDDLVQFCQNHSIVVNSYSPLGTPDWAPWTHLWNSSILDLPVIKSIAKSHQKSPAQVVLRWAWEKNIVLNPRSWNDQHMAENLDIFNFQLTEDDVKQIMSFPKPAVPKVCPDPHNIK
eukprot:m.306705 g.306705  ORF g.306705 m.306705 type:complete len:335 (+) comp41516_c0_seq1:50-1054(+)